MRFWTFPLLAAVVIAADPAIAANHIVTRGDDMRFAFFPPPPPPLAGQVSSAAPPTIYNGRPVEAPEELAPDVGESFYPALGTRLWEGALPDAIAARLEAHRTTRSALVLELLNELTAVQSADAAKRESHLRAFAVEQTPRVEAWEDAGEELGRDLKSGRYFRRTADWNAERKWRLSDGPVIAHGSLPLAEFQVMRAAAYYQEGLDVEQRWLLREIALDIAPTLQRSRYAAPSSSGPDAMFFSPGTARLRLPRELPPELAREIALYNGERETLKHQLRAAIADAEELSERKRVAMLAELCARQRPRLERLEVAAEEIRRGLADLPSALPKPPPPLPKELEQRIAAYKRDRGQLESDLREWLRSQPPLPRPIPSSPQEASEIARAYREAMMRQRHAAAEEFKRAHAARYDDLRERIEALRRDLNEIAQSMKDPATGLPMDAAALMRQYNSALLEFAAVGRREVMYSDYEIAMLQPGLSIAQRRLLFSAALARLAQPLPFGSAMPPRGHLTPSSWSL